MQKMKSTPETDQSIIVTVDAVLFALREKKFRAIAMSVFASGAIPPRDAIEWVCQQPNIEAIVFGASSRGNIRNTKALVDQYWPARAIV